MIPSISRSSTGSNYDYETTTTPPKSDASQEDQSYQKWGNESFIDPFVFRLVKNLKENKEIKLNQNKFDLPDSSQKKQSFLKRFLKCFFCI